jgi:hypothetical protein
VQAAAARARTSAQASCLACRRPGHAQLASSPRRDHLATNLLFFADRSEAALPAAPDADTRGRTAPRARPSAQSCRGWPLLLLLCGFDVLDASHSAPAVAGAVRAGRERVAREGEMMDGARPAPAPRRQRERNARAAGSTRRSLRSGTHVCAQPTYVALLRPKRDLRARERALCLRAACSSSVAASVRHRRLGVQYRSTAGSGQPLPHPVRQPWEPSCAAKPRTAAALSRSARHALGRKLRRGQQLARRATPCLAQPSWMPSRRLAPWEAEPHLLSGRWSYLSELAVQKQRKSDTERARRRPASGSSLRHHDGHGMETVT